MGGDHEVRTGYLAPAAEQPTREEGILGQELPRLKVLECACQAPGRPSASDFLFGAKLIPLVVRLSGGDNVGWNAASPIRLPCVSSMVNGGSAWVFSPFLSSACWRGP
jgi:hypothetical protein